MGVRFMIGRWQAALESQAKRHHDRMVLGLWFGTPGPRSQDPERAESGRVDRSALPARNSSCMYAARSRRDAGNALPPNTVGRRLGDRCAGESMMQNDENRGWRVPCFGSREPDGADFRRRAEQQHSADGTARGNRPTGAATTQAFASPYPPRYEERNAAAGPTIEVSATARRR